MKRAAIYARVSTDKQEREGTSLESQVRECLTHVKENGWSMERTVREQGSGGDIDGRPQLEALLALAQAKLIDVLVCYEIDRLSRDMDDLGHIRRLLRKAGVQLVFVAGDQNPIVQAVRGISGQDEREKIRERITRAKTQTAMQGRYLPGGKPPFGYQFDYGMIGRNERVVGLVEHPINGPILRQMYDFVARGGTATGCAKWLNRQGITAQRGGCWHRSSVVVVLRNPVYKGQPLMLQQQVVRHPITRRMSLKRRSLDDCVPLPAGTAPALVSAEKWQLANDQIDAGKTGARRNNQEPELWLLRAGFIWCGYCGKALSTGKTKGQPMYVCKHGIGSPCNSNASIYARDLDGAVWNMVKSVLQNPDWIRQSLKEQADAASFDTRITEQQSSLRRIRREESRLASRLGELDDATPVIARLNEVSSRRKNIEEEIDSLVFQQRNAAQVARRMHGLDERFLAAFERVEAMEYDEKRAILRQFGVNVKLWHREHEPRYAIDWQFDLGDDWFHPGDEDGWKDYDWTAVTADIVDTTN